MTRAHRSGIAVVLALASLSPIGADQPAVRNARATAWVVPRMADGRPDLEKGVGLTPRTDEHIANAAIEFIQRRPERPFFLHVNFTATHDPLLPLPEYESLYDPESIPLLAASFCVNTS